MGGRIYGVYAMVKYKILLFDADETLLDFPASEKEALKKVLEHFGIEYSEELRTTFSAINLALWKQLEKGLITRDVIRIRRFEQFVQAAGITADPKEMSALYVKFLGESCFVLPGAAELCEKLKEKYELYIVTNGIGTVQQSRLKKSGLLPYFKGVFVSEEIGSQKPDKKFFDFIFAKIVEKDKSKFIIIGDSMTSDILGGINAGIDTCFFNPWGREEIYTPTYTVTSFEELENLFS